MSRLHLQSRQAAAREWTKGADWLALASLLLVGCTEPAFSTRAMDAGSDAAAPRGDARPGVSSDTGTRDDAGLFAEDARAPGESEAGAQHADHSVKSEHDGGALPWWAPLEGHTNYVVRARFFGRDRTLGDAFFLSHEIVFWAKLAIERDAGRVAMELQRCWDQGIATSTLTLRDEYVFLHPERLAPEQHELVMRDGFIQSLAPARALGYQDAPMECTAGARLPARPEQPWLERATCQCGGEPLPLFANDCRITDADGDGEPGISVRHTGIQEFTNSVRAKDNCQIVKGTVDADGRIRGSYIENYDYLGLGCGTMACVHNDVVVCPPDLNPVLFEPLPDFDPSGAAWDCASIKTAAETRLPSEMLVFPADC